MYVQFTSGSFSLESKTTLTSRAFIRRGADRDTQACPSILPPNVCTSFKIPIEAASRAPRLLPMRFLEVPKKLFSRGS